MDDCTKKDLEQALRAVTSMVSRTEKAKEKFVQGTSQHTMLSNNLKALYIASALLIKTLSESTDSI